MADAEQKPPTRTRAPAARSKTPAAPKPPVLAKLENDIIDLDPNYYFSKRYDDIVEAASELPLIIEYVNESLQRAACAASEAKRDLQTLEAETYGHFRREWANLFAEKMTEKALEMTVSQDKNILEATSNYSVLKSYVTRLANMQENLRIKLDLLRSIEATKRKLIDDGPDDRT
jgi:hypothetical protein